MNRIKKKKRLSADYLYLQEYPNTLSLFAGKEVPRNDCLVIRGPDALLSGSVHIVGPLLREVINQLKDLKNVNSET